MGSAIVAGLLYAIGAVLTIVSTNKSNSEAMSRQIQNEDWQESMMDKQNEYNTPSAQTERLKEAGINPSVAYMHGSQVANTSAGVSSVPIGPVFDPATILGNLDLGKAYESIEQGLDIKTTREARLAHILRENDSLKANADFVGAQTVEQNIINRYSDAREILAREGQRTQLGINYYQRSLLKNQSSKMEYELINILPVQLQTLINQGKLQVLDMDKVVAEIADLKRSAELKEAQIGKTKAEEGLISAQEENTVVDTALKDEERGLLSQESGWYSETQKKYLEKYDEEIRKMASEANLTDEQAYYYCIELQGRLLDNSYFSINKRRTLQERVDKGKRFRPTHKFLNLR